MKGIIMAPRIYVADLAAYNAGILHGEWIELEGLTADDVNERVQDILDRGQKRYGNETLSQHEEWAIHDYDEFGSIEIEEYDEFDRVVSLAQGITDHGNAFAEFVSAFGLSAEDALAQFDDAFIGETSLKDYAYELADEMMDCEGLSAESLGRRYFDYDQFARDLVLGGDVVESNGHLFHSNW